MMALRSLPHTHNVYLRFINKTDREVDILWIDFGGGCVSYKVLINKNDFVDINTYKDHPWIAVDNKTHDRLCIDKQFVYYPKPLHEKIRELYPNRDIPPLFDPVRFKILITIPLYSLRFKTLLTLKDYFKNPKEVEDLQLPRELLNDLKKVISQRNMGSERVVIDYNHGN